MRLKWLKIILFVMVGAGVVPVASAQRIIQYNAGMGTRDPNNSDVWILYNKVKAKHEGMTLYTDSASFDTKNNVFVAHRNVKIVISDTTTLYGETAIYDGTIRVAEVWGDTVTLIDGRTVLTTDELVYNRETSTASYFNWGHTVHDTATLDSRMGFYHSDTRDLMLYGNVVLEDPSSRLETDTLMYNTRSCEARFVSPTYIYSDTSTVYSESGSYNTDSHASSSYKATRLTNGSTWLTSDTLYYNDNSEYGEAFGHVTIVDTANDVTCTGGMGVTDQKKRVSFVTDSALLVYVDKGDSVFVHADTVWAYNNSDGDFDAVKAYRNVRVYRDDAQGMCDSLYYSVPDSLVTLYHGPVVWYEDYQCTADTVMCRFDSSGVRKIMLRNNVFAIEKVDPEKFSQLKGHNADVYCTDGEPNYADILGSAQMVYYVVDEDSLKNKELIGVNCGVGSDMRIYFKDRKPSRVTTFGNPDMKMYPPDKLPESERTMQGFKWLDAQRPHNRHEVFPAKPVEEEQEQQQEVTN